jgi:hypothetical protein|tara:strand:- start:759 stop:1265 length:507 start_codon:yes stop_codon:yes gene_type:complete
MREIGASLIALLLSGCGPLYYLTESPEHKKVREEGYEFCHLQSCGPAALEEAFQYFGINKNQIEIGKEIQDSDHSHYRGIMSLASHDFTRITCPPELRRYCKSQGLTTKKIKYNKLSPGDVAIVLIKGKDSIDDWHWITWPNHDKSEIEDFFEESTKIISTYLLQKNN